MVEWVLWDILCSWPLDYLSHELGVFMSVIGWWCDHVDSVSQYRAYIGQRRFWDLPRRRDKKKSSWKKGKKGASSPLRCAQFGRPEEIAIPWESAGRQKDCQLAVGAWEDSLWLRVGLTISCFPGCLWCCCTHIKMDSLVRICPQCSEWNPAFQENLIHIIWGNKLPQIVVYFLWLHRMRANNKKS